MKLQETSAYQHLRACWEQKLESLQARRLNLYSNLMPLEARDLSSDVGALQDAIELLEARRFDNLPMDETKTAVMERVMALNYVELSNLLVILKSGAPLHGFVTAEMVRAS